MPLRASQVKLGLLAVALGSLAWGFQALLFRHAPDVFSNPQEDMSFAWYVPLFSLYVVWRERRELVASLGGPSWSGALATVPFLAIGFLGVRGVQVRLEELGFIGLLVTVPWTFYGRRTAGRLLFPAAFLLFCIPLATFLDVITVHLRLLAVSVAYAVLHGVGVDAIRQGTMISSASGAFSIDVAEPCSGLRSIFALLALTAGYAYFTQRTTLRKFVLFALAVPIAILGNVARILSICLVGTCANPRFATGFYHDYSGYVVFVVAILLMVAAGEALNRGGGR